MDNKRHSAFSETFEQKFIAGKDEGVEELIKAADRNEAEALYEIGLLYFHGNDAEALTMIGKHFYKKKTDKADYGYAFEWFSDAADLGHAKAAYCAGAMIQELNGTEVHARVKDAIKYLKLAAESGNGRAKERLNQPIPKDLLQLRISEPATGEHRMDLAAFRRLRKPWLLLALIPSFALDILTLGGNLCDFAVFHADFFTALWNAVFVLFVNAVVYKLLALYFYGKLRDACALGVIHISDKEVRMIRYRLHTGGDGGLDDIKYYSEFCINRVNELHVLKNGTLIVNGDIEQIKYEEWMEQKTIASPAKAISTLRIPAYYVDMQGIMARLEELRDLV